MAKRSTGFRACGPGPEGTVLKAGKGGRLQRVKTGGAFWSEEAEGPFLDALAASCNVTLAAEAVGFTTCTVYRQRRLNPEFARAWEAAMDEGFSRLREALLRSAIDSVEGRPMPADAPLPPMTVDQAMNLLKLHGGEVRGDGRRPGRRPRTRSLDEVRGSILRKLEAIEAAEREALAGEAAERDAPAGEGGGGVDGGGGADDA